MYKGSAALLAALTFFLAIPVQAIIATKFLKPGDVVILRDDHSGYVNSKGTIDHFIQVYGTTTKKEIMRYDAQNLPRHLLPNNTVGGLYLGDTLKQFLARPFYKGPIGSLEIWRRVKGGK